MIALQDNNGNGTMPFARTKGTIGPKGYRLSVNMASSYVDGSMVYGPTEAWNAKLRTYEGGKMKVSKGPTGDLLPLNRDIELSMAPGGNTSLLFAAGDHRANVNHPMLVLHTLFHLEHNWRAEQVAEENPEFGDEEIFQEARKYVIALIQKEFFNHYAPLVTGTPLPPYSGYNSNLNPSIDTTFMTTAFRYGHSAVSSSVYLMEENRRPAETGHLSVGPTLFNPKEIREHGLDRIIRGLAMNPEGDVDLSLAQDIRYHPIIADLGANDINRGRDRGCASFNEIRRQLGLIPYQTWEELNHAIKQSTKTLATK